MTKLKETNAYRENNDAVVREDIEKVIEPIKNNDADLIIKHADIRIKEIGT